MTDIENEARRRLNEAGWKGGYVKREWNVHYEALCRLLEEHEAFKREVSDAVGALGCWPAHINLDRFIIPKPVDPLVEVVKHWSDGEMGAVEAISLREVLAKRGYEIRENAGE